MNHLRSFQTVLGAATVVLLTLAPIPSSRASAEFASPPVAPAQSDAATLTDAQLQTLAAPIALYPDPLIAQILPASTYPLQVVIAARWLQANPNPAEASIDAQAVEPSIKAILHYPTVLAMMNDQLDWTQSLGVAFLNQQPDLMNAIQELRVQAQSAGSLQTTPQQEVVMDGDAVQILPAQSNIVYVPQYNPQIAYMGDGQTGMYLTFGMGYPQGLWLDNNVDWQHRWVAGGRSRPGDERGNSNPWARNRAQPLPVRVRAPAPEAPRALRPGYEASRAPAAPGAFQGYQNRAAVQRAVDRVQQNRPAPQAKPAPQARPAPAEAFHAEGNAHPVAAQSARGNASRGATAGGGSRGGGGAHK